MGAMQDALLSAVDKGYRVEGKYVIGPARRPLKLLVSRKGYPRFKVRHAGESHFVAVHRLVAFFAWGETIFEEGIVVRHMDGNKHNFHVSNLQLGTVRDNSLDEPLELRVARAKHAAAERKLSQATQDTIVNLRKCGHTYAYIAKELGISHSCAHRYGKMP